MNDEKELIVLVHGFGSKRLYMWPMVCLLRARGFRVQQWSYLSLFDPIETHANRFYKFLQAVSATESRFHIVAHSMGSIVARASLNQSSLPSLGRLIMLAPPNRGSPAARMASKILGRVIVPTQELSDSATSYVNQLERTTNVEIGIIAARFDVLVPIANTHLTDVKSHVVINATHNTLLVSIGASNLIVKFLTHGSFVERATF